MTIFKQVYELAHSLKTETRRVVKPGEMLCHDDELTWLMRTDKRGNMCIKYQVGNDYPIIPKMYQKAIGRYRLLAIEQEPVQMLTHDDALAEGIWRDGDGYTTSKLLHKHTDCPVRLYRHLWDAINNKPGLRWLDCPLVWVLKFEVLHIDLKAAQAWIPVELGGDMEAAS